MFATLTQAEVEQRETQKQVVNVSGVFSVVGFHGIKLDLTVLGEWENHVQRRILPYSIIYCTE